MSAVETAPTRAAPGLEGPCLLLRGGPLCAGHSCDRRSEIFSPALCTLACSGRVSKCQQGVRRVCGLGAIKVGQKGGHVRFCLTISRDIGNHILVSGTEAGVPVLFDTGTSGPHTDSSGLPEPQGKFINSVLSSGSSSPLVVELAQSLGMPALCWRPSPSLDLGPRSWPFPWPSPASKSGSQ